MIRKIVLCSLLAWGSAVLLPAEATSFLEYGILPDLTLPLGTDGDLFTLGGGTTVTLALRPAALPPASAGLAASYAWLPTKAPGVSLSASALAAQVGYRFSFSRSLSLGVQGEAGYFAATANTGASPFAANPFVGGGADLALEVAPGFTLGLGVGVRSWAALLTGASAHLGLTYSVPLGAPSTAVPGTAPIQNRGRGLQFAALGLDTIFPVFYKHYDDHPIGTLVIRNYESVPARNPKVLVNVRSYMDEAKPLILPAEIPAGGQIEVPVYALFTDKVLGIVESTKIPVDITLEYEQFGAIERDQTIATLSVLDRNAITWDDDRKAAAFISARDPEALSLAKGISAALKPLLNPVVNPNLQTAMAFHDALRSQGLAYVQDPTSALETNDKKVVDFILFPQQTLGYNSGKCSDLTVLYCSLLESVGIQTALITIPGHILMAVDLEMDPQEALGTFARADDLIVRNNRVWLPLETTDRTGDFQQAWREGAQQWRDGSARKTAAFYPVHDSWKEYAPVVLPRATATSPRFEVAKGTEAFHADLDSYVNLEVGPRAAALQAQMKKSGATPELANRLGVLYARYGFLDKAQEQFTLAVGKKESNPSALLNLGNLQFLKGKYADALVWYNKALKLTPNKARAYLAIARTNAALGKFDAAVTAFKTVTNLDPQLASAFAYLGGQDGGVRAAEADTAKRNLLWQD